MHGRRVALAAAAIALSLLAAEAAWRLLLASDTRLGRRQRNPALYADPFSDDLFWLLRHRWHSDRFAPPDDPHPLLGWRGASVGADYSHAGEGKVGGRRPVLLYGDSFAQGMRGVERFQTILNRDEEFAEGHYLLNYGVGGYGLDQIHLLFQHSVERFDDPFVVFSFMTFDLDRSVLSVRVGQKPYFEVVDGRLELRGVPIESDAEAFFAAHPPRVGSYLWRRVSRLTGLGGERAARKKTINGAILDAVLKELEDRRLDYTILVFHARKAFRLAPDWRSHWLRSFLDERGEDYLWSYDILHREGGEREVDELFDPKNVHPTSLANRILARAIAERVLAAR